MASFFKQLSDNMEMVARVVEEGAKFMMGEVQMGEQGISAGLSVDSSFAIGDGAHYGDEDAFNDGDVDAIGDAYGSPLMGMADSVLSDIMSSQVCYLACILTGSDHSTSNLNFNGFSFFTGRPPDTKRTHSSLHCCNHVE